MSEGNPEEGELEAAATHLRVMRRVRRTALVSAVVFALVYATRADWLGLLGLTCSAALSMINFLWLEDIVRKVLEPAPRVKAWKLGLKTFARFTLLALALSVAVIVVRFNVLSVLLGISVVVIGIMGEALYALFLSLKSVER
jgi:hypothetical protein